MMSSNLDIRNSNCPPSNPPAHSKTKTPAPTPADIALEPLSLYNRQHSSASPINQRHRLWFFDARENYLHNSVYEKSPNSSGRQQKENHHLHEYVSSHAYLLLSQPSGVLWLTAQSPSFIQLNPQSPGFIRIAGNGSPITIRNTTVVLTHWSLRRNKHAHKHTVFDATNVDVWLCGPAATTLHQRTPEPGQPPPS
jgi:hypothetical protein